MGLRCPLQANTNMLTFVNNSKVQSEKLLKAMAVIAAAASTDEAEGDKDKATGVAWYPLKGAKTLSDLGGDILRVGFPVGRELMSHPDVKIYQCHFTLLDAKGSPTKDTRVSAAVAAETPRTFGCTTPAWGKGGEMPKAKTWKTAVAILENDRLMPSPKAGTTLNWVPNSPSAVFPNPAYGFSGGKNKKKTFTIDFKLDYPYGPNGYKDLRFTMSADSKEVSDIKVTGSGESAARKLQFAITTAQKAPAYKVTIKTSSASTGLSTSTSVTINYKLYQGIGKGGTASEYLTNEAAEQLHKKAGCKDPSKCSEEWTLCYSAKQHGWSSSQFHSRCASKGPLFLVNRRGGNKRISGGFANVNYRWTGGGYIRNNDQRHFLYRVEPNNNKKVTFVTKCCNSYVVYPHPSYLMCFGGGHDWCSNNGGNVWHNTGHDYRRPGGNWQYNKYREEGNYFFDGAYNHNARNEKDDYEVYLAKGV